MSHPSPRLLFRPQWLVLILSLGLVQHAFADEDEDIPAVCPVGVLKCPKKSKKTQFELCKRNDLLDFYVPGLPTEGDRSKVPADLATDKVSSTDRTHYQFEGNVQLQRLDELLRADFMTFETETTDYTAHGNVRTQDRKTLMSADQAHGTGTPSTAFLDNVHYQFLSSRGNGVAETANLTDPDHAKLHEGTYTTCDPDDPRWHLHGRDMEVDYVANEAYVHGATLYYGNLPFF